MGLGFVQPWGDPASSSLGFQVTLSSSPGTQGLLLSTGQAPERSLQ